MGSRFCCIIASRCCLSVELCLTNAGDEQDFESAPAAGFVAGASSGDTAAVGGAGSMGCCVDAAAASATGGPEAEAAPSGGASITDSTNVHGLRARWPPPAAAAACSALLLRTCSSEGQHPRSRRHASKDAMGGGLRMGSRCRCITTSRCVSDGEEEVCLTKMDDDDGLPPRFGALGEASGGTAGQVTAFADPIAARG